MSRTKRTLLSHTLDEYFAMMYYHYRKELGGMIMSATPTRSKRTRSPNYPAISLVDAIGRLKAIYETQRQYPATREVLVKLMGYGSLNGASSTVVSALSKYGLLEGHGENLRVSDLGQDLVLHRKGDPEYTRALQTAAFMPGFFQELHDQYTDGLPGEHSLRATLVKRGFNPKAIDSAVRAYRETMEFLDAETGGFSARSRESSATEMVWQPQPLVPSANPMTPSSDDGRQRVVSLPLSVTEWATLQAPFPLTEIKWNQMIAVLTAMKPALVAPREQPPKATDEQVEQDDG
jgi:hypothetical protein